MSIQLHSNFKGYYYNYYYGTNTKNKPHLQKLNPSNIYRTLMLGIIIHFCHTYFGLVGNLMWENWRSEKISLSFTKKKKRAIKTPKPPNIIEGQPKIPVYISQHLEETGSWMNLGYQNIFLFPSPWVYRCLIINYNDYCLKFSSTLYKLLKSYGCRCRTAIVILWNRKSK